MVSIADQIPSRIAHRPEESQEVPSEKQEAMLHPEEVAEIDEPMQEPMEEPGEELLLGTEVAIDRCDTSECHLSLRSATLVPVLEEARALLLQTRAEQPIAEYDVDLHASDIAMRCENAFHGMQMDLREEETDQIITVLSPLNALRIPEGAVVRLPPGVAAAAIFFLLGELHFRAGSPARACAAFRQVICCDAEVRAHRDILRLAHVGCAATRELFHGKPGVPTDRQYSADMAAALALHRLDFAGGPASIFFEAPMSSCPEFAIVLLGSIEVSTQTIQGIGEKLRDAVKEPCRLVFPRGLYGPSGFGWKDKKIDPRDPFRRDSLLRTVAQIGAIIDFLEASGIALSQILLAGVSTGSFVAAIVALSHHARLGGLLVLGMAGMVVDKAALRFAQALSGSAAMQKDVPVFVGMPAGMKTKSRATVDEFKSLGVRHVELHVYKGMQQHVPEEVTSDMGCSVRRWMGLHDTS
eukprot:gnl/TRDRNA2_/TRDRNA2_140428_c2_seq1.p1 gnl/TRDRNA2_/TRDRNA2_140428_c2~~gnl/TRDRNA2_/TRDRNA2_140428_c2_seq1.p1  ORF type:complete len:468 (+),score=81.79 gnl/TRDRNA2_/TRDRNA2_140428_c2_seq1:2-1405(+)